MTDTSAAQVGTAKEDTQMQFIQTMVTFLQDAAHLPELRREAERLRTEVESLNKQKTDLEVEIQLEREERAKFASIANSQEKQIYDLKQRVQSLQHKFDTINGVVMAAMAEIERDKPKLVETPAQGKPWEPLPEPSRSSHFS